MGDGVICPLAPLRSYKISEATKYHLILNVGVNTFIMMAHKPLWESMPQDMRDWLKAEGGMKMSLAIGRSLEDGVKADTKWMEGQGHEFFYLTEADRSQFLAPLKVFTDKWVNEECKGMDPSLLKEVLKFTQERSKYHTEKMRAGAYGDYKM
jgi:TRAP-type C4-dicarboxylate transport system substrate-binding protein